MFELGGATSSTSTGVPSAATTKPTENGVLEPRNRAMAGGDDSLNSAGRQKPEIHETRPTLLQT
jgi:hypothetical protein